MSSFINLMASDVWSEADDQPLDSLSLDAHVVYALRHPETTEEQL